MTRLVFAEKELTVGVFPAQAGIERAVALRAFRFEPGRCAPSPTPKTSPRRGCTARHARAWRDSLRGGAYGDAWGNTNEFRSYTDPTRQRPARPELPSALVITDDTQMTLALARALHNANSKPRDTLRADIVGEFVTWRADPDNNRGPGTTCTRATGALAAGHDWTEATVPGSDGCGTVMRVSPAAYCPSDCGDRSRPGRPRSPTAPPPVSPRRF